MEENNFGKLARTHTYNAANSNAATMAAIRLLLRNKTLPIRAATNTKITERLVFAQFKYDQSTDNLIPRLIIEGGEKSLRGLPASTPAREEAAAGILQDILRAAQSSSIDEWANAGSFSSRNTS